MDVHWSPRKRIKLSSNASSAAKPNPKSPAKSERIKSPSGKGVETQDQKQSLKRMSTDFDKELEELLEQPDNGLNPTQMFLVDPEVELAMLRADIDQPAFSDGPMRTMTRTLSRWETTPLTDATNVLPVPAKRHASDPVQKALGFTQVTNQLVDEFAGIDINELTSAIETAETLFNKSTQECTQASSDMFSTRCVVDEVPIYSPSEPSGVGMRVTEESTGKTRFVTLRGVWLDAYQSDPWQVQVGDSIHLLAGCKQWEADHVVIGDSSSLFPDIIVFHPDCVISSTTLSASATCHRRSVVQNRVLAPSIGPAPTDPDDINRMLSPIIGNCVHEAVQAAAAVNDFSESFVLEAGEKAMSDFMLPGVWACGGAPAAVLAQLRSRLSFISKWGTVEWPRIASRLRGCETEIRPKCLGVTGKLDMDIEDTSGARSCIEIKTGKPHAIHVGQVVLYYLLQYIDKHGGGPAAASLPAEISQEYILLYLPAAASAESIKVKITAREAQNIMRNRNLVASHTVKKSLPGPIFKKGDCQFCPTRIECASHYLSDGVEGEEGKRFFAATQFQVRNSTALCDKRLVIEYQRKWLAWIDKQPTVEALGGLSAVRRMRGNVLHMTAACLLKESGVHEGNEAAFLNWMPVLTGAATHSLGQKSLAQWLMGEKKSKTGRAACIESSLAAEETGKKLIGEIISPYILKNSRILICATSHTAVDSVLTLLQASGVLSSLQGRVTRLASKPEDVAEAVRETMSLPTNWQEQIGEIEEMTKIFACTVKAVHHDLLSRGDFDLAVVIDANKLTDAALWGVLLRSRQVLLVGSPSAGEDDSEDLHLFRRLVASDKVPVARWREEKREELETVVIDE